ncbi:unnamed protein product [Paramecium sonneborni]|uniref:Uncharacterized protein n=1 Tax=Paramecium sonneborni TaxID=65129 RepID=A0A8S1MG36_9CILI|nr:unnamed protein product [Paramecium sonneborni]
MGQKYIKLTIIIQMNDNLLLEGYGETNDKKVVYQQKYDQEKKIVKFKDKPQY